MKVQEAILHWFDGKDSGWVICFIDPETNSKIWSPPVDKDYFCKKNINKNKQRAIVRNAAKLNGLKMKHGFKLIITKDKENQ